MTEHTLILPEPQIADAQDWMDECQVAFFGDNPNEKDLADFMAEVEYNITNKEVEIK